MGSVDLIRENRDQSWKMKVFVGLAAVATATVDSIPTDNWWPANVNAPHCGCQIIIDPAEYGGYINSTCTIKFPYADTIHYGRGEVKINGNAQDPHFLSVASSYMVGRDKVMDNIDGFKFTGFDEVSNPDVLDILVFYDTPDCARRDASGDREIYEIPKWGGDLPQDQWWEVFNVTHDQGDMMCEFELECVDNGAALPGVYLGNFNYDIARSVQTYTVPIYGLQKGQQANFDIMDYDNDPADCMNPLAHSGHGTASGCSSNMNDTAGCSNDLSFAHDQDHNGLLEYFQFEPVSPVNNPVCFALPLHHVDDYKWATPSPWDTQEAFDQNNDVEFI